MDSSSSLVTSARGAACRFTGGTGKELRETLESRRPQEKEGPFCEERALVGTVKLTEHKDFGSGSESGVTFLTQPNRVYVNQPRQPKTAFTAVN